jgi:hypothetical protein
MANEEHVRRLRDEGVKAWSAWRETKPGVRPHLAGANLKTTIRPPSSVCCGI